MKFIYAILALSAVSASAEDLVRCKGKYNGEKEEIQLKIGSNGKIVQWNETQLAKSDTPYLGGLAQNIEDSYEWTKNLRAPNGATILEVGTTADSFKIAISANRKNASFVYRDLGSGAGNHSFELNCSVLN